MLHDGVAELTGAGLIIASSFDGWPAGEYPVDLCVVNNSGDQTCPDDPNPVLYRWDPGRALPLKVRRDVTPGLYRLHLCERDGGVYAWAGVSALILAVPSTSFPRVHEAFARVLEATKGWDATDPTAVGLRRVYLQALAGN